MNVESGLPSYKVTGTVGSRVIGIEMDVIGGRNANDAFFSAQGKLDLLDVQKAAYSNFLVNAVTRILGMRGLTWDNVAEGTSDRITREQVSQIGYKSKASRAEQSTQAQNGKDWRTGPISEAQQKRLFAIASECGWTRDELKTFLSRKGYEHTKEIPKERYNEIIEEIQAGGSH
jgi:hypothetical protein